LVLELAKRCKTGVLCSEFGTYGKTDLNFHVRWPARLKTVV
jgi:hypothetical protein